MYIKSVEFHTIEIPLVSPFETSFGVQSIRTALLLEVQADVEGERLTGWGECVALPSPLYSSEYLSGATGVMRKFLLPLLFAAQSAEPGHLRPETVARILSPVVGHPMAKAALEMAMLDVVLRFRGQSFSDYLGGTATSVPAGVSVGIHSSVDSLLDAVAGYVDEGYARIKLKIKPGWDVQPVQAVRDRFGDDLLLQVDANAAYTLSDASCFRKLDQFGLLLIEQPLHEDDMRQHAELALQLRTPICLDESITSARAAADAIILGAARVINIKAGRVGGYLEARKIHDLAEAHGVAVWCGGMLETGLGRAANAGLASMPGFTLPGDISASSRFYETDITEPIVIDDGRVAVPTKPGIGADPLPELVKRFRVDHSVLTSE